MKESEYIDATDLAKLRAAYTILGDTIGKGAYSSLGNRRAPLFTGLTIWIEEVESRLRGKLEE